MAFFRYTISTYITFFAFVGWAGFPIVERGESFNGAHYEASKNCQVAPNRESSNSGSIQKNVKLKCTTGNQDLLIWDVLSDLLPAEADFIVATQLISRTRVRDPPRHFNNQI